MSLVKNIVELSGCFRQETKDMAIRDYVEFYKKHAMGKVGLNCPILNKALEGKLIIKEEYERLGPQEFLKKGGVYSVFEIVRFKDTMIRQEIDDGMPTFPKDLDLDTQVEILSGHIERLYKK